MQELRDKLTNKILKEIPNTSLNGPEGNNRLANNINISFNNIEGESIGGYLENQGIFVFPVKIVHLLINGPSNPI